MSYFEAATDGHDLAPCLRRRISRFFASLATESVLDIWVTLCAVLSSPLSDFS
nr:MAG TPA: hypothetical protein [Caudoviricetes sp.]